ncbi:MAG: hypothetical protein H7Z41_01470 [Cytophagales bacterium]|nr:hypothetical protein [Armatimonadota bacterium]
MKIFPQDLRESYHGEVIVLRSNYGGAATSETRALTGAHTQTRKPVGRLGRLWLGKLPFTSDQAEMALPASATATQGIAWLSQIMLTGVGGLVAAMLHKNGVCTVPEAWALTALAGGVLGYPSFVLWPRAALKGLYSRPLSVTEVEGLMPRAQTELERAYLGLVRETILQPVPEIAAADVRVAIQALGQAVDALPLVESAPVDTNALRGEAASLRTQARQEGDRIIADSQENRADALERRADSADRSAQYARRIQALQEEIAAQIAATRQDLSAFCADGGGAAVNSASLAHLADTGRRIATVAVSAARARAELDGVFATPPSFTESADWKPTLAAEEPTAQNLQVTIK